MFASYDSEDQRWPDIQALISTGWQGAVGDQVTYHMAYERITLPIIVLQEV